jgi:two-component system, NtrC family, response regulator
MATILVVDDEKNYRWMLKELLEVEQYDVSTCEKVSDALAVLRESRIDLLLTDLRMGEADGMTLLAQARKISPTTTTILMTAYGTIERAVKAMRLGAYDFIVKPFENVDLLRAVAKGIDQSTLVRENLRLSRSLAPQYHFDNLIGQSIAMRTVFEKIKRVTDSKSTVLVSGESGSGKELVARAIHFNGPRCGRPFVAVNCGALTTTLAESELFGHERGAFTGANTRHQGMFEQANTGTIFLDEVSELPIDLQSKLLRVLDTQEVRRVGSERTFHVDVRILAATNRDLKADIKHGRFRDDLFFRLSVVRIDVPPLRERGDDLILLAQEFLRELVKQGSSHGKRLAPATLKFLTRYQWPGNVRELHNAVAHAACMAQHEEIQPDDFPLELAATGEWLQALDRILPPDAPLDPTLKAVEHHMIARALTRAEGVQARAADLLKISRSLLQYKLKTFGTSPDQAD